MSLKDENGEVNLPERGVPGEAEAVGCCWHQLMTGEHRSGLPAVVRHLVLSSSTIVCIAVTTIRSMQERSVIEWHISWSLEGQVTNMEMT